MEFIIVFPIYLVLFAGTVAIGDMLFHSNRLVTADRVAAFGVEGWAANGWDLVVGRMFHPGVEIADDRNDQDSLQQVTSGRYADDSGPWSVCAAATALDDYRPLAGGTLGQLLGARVLLGGTATGKLPSELQTWSSGAGVEMRSKGTDVAHCHYVLKRRRSVGLWRDLTSGLLPRDLWLGEVVNEAWFDRETITDGKESCDPAGGADIPEYGRYPWPLGWQ